MTCDKFQAFLPDMMLEPSHVSAAVRQHLAECSACRTEWNELQATMQLLDEWKAPEPSPYFDTRMAARLRQEKTSEAPAWWQRVRARLLFDSSLHFRPAMAAALGLLLIVGAGTYEEFSHLNRTPPPAPAVSATVKDLELLDSNAQTLQQLASFDETDATVGPAAGANSSSGGNSY